MTAPTPEQTRRARASFRHLLRGMDRYGAHPADRAAVVAYLDSLDRRPARLRERESEAAA